ncbi:MAG: MBL fold metallo-hydrolase [Bacilli bacterium]|nr:MBL fold metallo-hydrolase [Bacilli bacterium]
MKVVALVENTTKLDCPVEHGLSLYIETKRHRILFDTGQGRLFEENAKRFGVDLSLVDLCILSHGHYDHGGGLYLFHKINPNAPIYLSSHAFEPHYHGSDRYIGLNQDFLEDPSFRSRLVYVDGSLAIDDELEILPPKGEKRVEVDDDNLLVKENNAFVPDDFRHEHYLLIKEGGKRVLISGCSHQGVINIASWYKPDVLIGGFHIRHHELNEGLVAFGKMLNEYDTVYYTCHCTGVEQYEYLFKHMDKLHYLSEGEVIEL